MRSAEATSDVFLRSWPPRRGENALGFVEFQEFAEIHECGEIEDARRLPHVVGDDRDGKALFQFVDQFFDFSRRKRIQRGTGFVEENNFGVNSHRARDAQALLLAAGTAEAARL